MQLCMHTWLVCMYSILPVIRGPDACITSVKYEKNMRVPQYVLPSLREWLPFFQETG